MKHARLLTGICCLALGSAVPAAELPYLPLGAPIPALRFNLADNAVFASRTGDILTITIPPDQAQGVHIVAGRVDLAPYVGRTVQFSIPIRAKNVSKPPDSWNGVKFMLQLRRHDGKNDYPGATLPSGSFDWRYASFDVAVPEGASGDLRLGLQSSSGTVEFDLAKLRILDLRANDSGAVQAAYSPEVGQTIRRRGMMLSQGEMTQNDLETLRSWNVNLIRFQFCRNWSRKNTDTDLADYDRWFDERLKNLEFLVEEAPKYGIKVAIDLHTPPGGWVGKLNEMRMFDEPVYAAHFLRLWKRLAEKFKGNPGVWAYDLINEPRTRSKGCLDFWKLQLMTARLIRSIDTETPILVTSNWGGGAFGWNEMPVIELKNIIYQFHFYDPISYTHQYVHQAPKAGESYRAYPGELTSNGKTVMWNQRQLEKQLAEIRQFQSRHNAIIYVGEFSAVLWAPGAEQYLRDSIDLFEQYRWHWSYHAFRESYFWNPEMNYVDGKPVPAASDTPRLAVLKSFLRRNSTQSENLLSATPAAAPASVPATAPMPSQTTEERTFHAFPLYRQELCAEFADEAAAQQAKLEMCKLPDGKTAAFTIRGDDTNGRHVELAELLRRYGFRAGFLFNHIPDSFAKNSGKRIMATGSSAGNHSATHPRLPDFLPNAIYNEIVVHQAEVESQLNAASVSFTLPFCAATNDVDAETPSYIGEALRRAGIFVSTEGSNPYGIPKGAYFSSERMPWFSGADSNPPFDKMEKAYQASLAKAKSNPDVPRVSYGTHTLYNTEGFRALEQFLAAHRDDPGLWKCNENEYGAYRYTYCNAAPTQQQQGSSVRFMLRRISANDLGSDIPLSVKISPKPLRVTLNGQELTPAVSGVYAVPAPGAVPRTIVRMNADGTSAKLPGVTARLHYDQPGNRLNLAIANRTGKPLSDLTIRVTAPLCWKEGVYTRLPEELNAGEEKTFTFPLGDGRTEPYFRDGKWVFQARCDAVSDGVPVRFYAQAIHENPVVRTAGARDTALFVGPIATDRVSQEMYRNISMPGAPLVDFGTQPNEKWWNINSDNPVYRDFVINTKMSDKSPVLGAWQKATAPFFTGKNKGVRLFVLEFIAPRAGQATLVCPSHPKTLEDFYLNGTPQPFQWRNKWVPKPNCPIEVRQGVNRLLLINPISSNWSAQQLAVNVRIVMGNEILPCAVPSGPLSK